MDFSFTAKSQHEDDIVLRRRLRMIWLHEHDGEQQLEISKRWGISQARGWQIYHKAKQSQKRGLI